MPNNIITSQLNIEQSVLSDPLQSISLVTCKTHCSIYEWLVISYYQTFGCMVIRYYITLLALMVLKTINWELFVNVKGNTIKINSLYYWHDISIYSLPCSFWRFLLPLGFGGHGANVGKRPWAVISTTKSIDTSEILCIVISRVNSSNKIRLSYWHARIIFNWVYIAIQHDLYDRKFNYRH